jgi:hypothetical protein
MKHTATNMMVASGCGQVFSKASFYRYSAGTL